MSRIASSAPAISTLRTTQPISIRAVWSRPFGAGATLSGVTRSNVTVLDGSLARLVPSPRRHAAVSTSATDRAGQHREMLRLPGERHAARAAAQGSVGIAA